MEGGGWGGVSSSLCQEEEDCQEEGVEEEEVEDDTVLEDEEESMAALVPVTGLATILVVEEQAQDSSLVVGEQNSSLLVGEQDSSLLVGEQDSSLAARGALPGLEDTEDTTEIKDNTANELKASTLVGSSNADSSRDLEVTT